MRVLLVTPEFPPALLGGVGRYSVEVAHALQARVDLTVLYAPTYGGGCYCDDACVATAGTIDPLVIRPVMTGVMSKLVASHDSSCLRDAVREAEWALMATPIATSEPFDVAFVQDYASAPVAAALLRSGRARQVTAACHLPLYAGFTYFDRTIADDMHQMLEAMLLRLSSSVVVPSAFTRSILLRTYNLRPEQIHVVPLGAARKTPIVARDHLQPTLTLGMVARFTEQKGLHYLPPLVHQLSALGIDARVQLLGAGDGRHRFEALIRDSPDAWRIEIVDSVPPDAVWDFYDGLDFFISTSLYETFGLAPLEAMASARIPIGFGITALNELFGPLTEELLVPVGHVDAMASAIAGLACDESRRRALVCNVQAHARAFGWERHADALLDLWSTTAQ